MSSKNKDVAIDMLKQKKNGQYGVAWLRVVWFGYRQLLTISYHFEILITALLTTHVDHSDPQHNPVSHTSALYANRSWRREGKLKQNDFSSNLTMANAS